MGDQTITYQKKAHLEDEVCKTCGEPASNKTCKTCQILKELKKK